MSTPVFDAYFSPEALEDIYTQEGVDAYHARVNGAHIRSVYQNIPHTLNLFFHKFGNYFTILLADALCENTSVEALGLELNQIGDRGAKALAWALTINRSVLNVDLSNNHIGTEGILALARGPMRQSRIIVSWNLCENMNRKRNEPFCEVESAYREVIAMLKQNKCLLHYHGPYEREVQSVIEANRMRVDFLVDIILHFPEAMNRDQLLDLQESFGAVYYALRESGFSMQAIIKLFTRIKRTAARFGIAISVPSMPQIRATAHFMPGKHTMKLDIPAANSTPESFMKIVYKEIAHS